MDYLGGRSSPLHRHRVARAEEPPCGLALFALLARGQDADGRLGYNVPRAREPPQEAVLVR
eukprot:6210809-Pyramimonas_sp.AAC.1